MSDTPRTDKAEKECVYDKQLLEFARSLERELIEANRTITELNSMVLRIESVSTNASKLISDFAKRRRK